MHIRTYTHIHIYTHIIIIYIHKHAHTYAYTCNMLIDRILKQMGALNTYAMSLFSSTKILLITQHSISMADNISGTLIAYNYLTSNEVQDSYL